MLLDQTLLISISFACVITILLFLYFKRKITSLEFKLDSLFKLIEQHSAEQKNQPQYHQSQSYNSHMVGEAQSEEQEDNKRIINLIPVSDNELSSSEEEFTTEEEEEEEGGEYFDDQQSIKEEVTNELNNSYLETPEAKLVNLQPLEQVETTDIETIQQLGEQMEEELTQSILQKIEQAEQLVSLVGHTEELDGELGEELSELSELEDEELESKIVEITNEDLIDGENLKNELKNVNVSKLTAPKLRDLVNKYNLVDDSKKLKKAELIELLQKHQ